MAAAVADYSPEHPSTEKIKKTTKDLQLTLQPTADILKTLAAKRKSKWLSALLSKPIMK